MENDTDLPGGDATAKGARMRYTDWAGPVFAKEGVGNAEFLRQ